MPNARVIKHSSEEWKLPSGLVEAVEPVFKITNENCIQKHTTQPTVILFLTISAVPVPSQKLFSTTGHLGLEEGRAYLLHSDYVKQLLSIYKNLYYEIL